MANSIFVPIERLPSGMDELRNFISAAFTEFSQPVPIIRQEGIMPSNTHLNSGFLIVEGLTENDQCWASIHRCGPALTGGPDCELMVDIKTRGNWMFAGVVAYAFCRLAGSVIFNDACELDGQEEYTADSIKDVLLKNLTKNGGFLATRECDGENRGDLRQ
ncbi:hypothetical protein [Herbaspirillum seropedicae]|uniref:hypothetical protein n=1 Tax=Herbaspirillum seropedicae TaxID=964 RepID=UPI000863A275|nr:hypothetical protein [Herbaspirillum seropedicae]AON55496.1 hypothetical protein Hsc_3228 [Herbaspirillum seropedicae]